MIPAYSASPCYPSDSIECGAAAPIAALGPDTRLLAVDGPVMLDWPRLTTELSEACLAAGIDVRVIPAERFLRPADEITALTGSPLLEHDPDFATIPSVGLEDLFTTTARENLPEPDGDLLTIIFGPGAALFDPDRIWYADLPKRYAEAAHYAGHGQNLAGAPDAGTTQRLFYIDWPLLDRHRGRIALQIDRWLDTQGPQLLSIAGPELRRSLDALTLRPFRTQPIFNSTSWGGHWAQHELHVHQEAVNTALGYELIAPEAGILLGDPAQHLEVPFGVMIALDPVSVLGADVHEQFADSFPIRFDYLDTVGGGNLSVHCHPQPEYMREVFGGRYTQLESYYCTVAGEDSVIYLGLTDGVDVDAFHAASAAAAGEGVPLDVDRYVQHFPARAHQLYMIPAGTPHGSGAGNVVLEISATPYLYSLRFYDWMRTDPIGAPRPVHVEHAFANLNRHRTGPQVSADLIQEPRILRKGSGWREELIGRLADVFFEVRRLIIEPAARASDDTAGRFHVLNVAAGHGVILRTEDGTEQTLAYAETAVVPAAVGRYEIIADGTEPVYVVKAQVAP